MADASNTLIELPSSPPPSLPSHPVLRQKRTRSSDVQDDSTPSDGPLFSSDPPDPSLDNYFQPRRKRQYRGTWWGEVAHDSPQTESLQRGKTGFVRNMDSGIWMGSDNTEDSLGSEDSMPDEEALPQPDPAAARSFTRLPPEPESVKRAREVIQRCLETSIDHVDLRELGLTHVSNDLIKPLHSLVESAGYFDRDSSPDDEEYRTLKPDLELYFSQNAFYTLPLELFNLENITKLHLNGNNLTTLSPHISKLKNLTTLDISSNRLRWLPWELLPLLRSGQLHTFNTHSNPLFQPFTYLGPWAQSENSSSPGMWCVPLFGQLLDRLKRADITLALLHEAKLRGRTLQDIDGYGDDPRTLEQAIEQTTWMGHFYATYDAAPIGAEGFKDSWAICLASTPVSHFEFDGSPILTRDSIAPSLMPQDTFILPAVLQSREDFQPHAAGSRVPSLFELAVHSAIRASQHDVTQLFTLLPDDAPTSVTQSLKTAITAHEEGGRICTVCNRSYIIPRTEWVEYWHGPTGLAVRRKEDLFLPFLRRGCSLKCLPGTNDDA